MEEFKGLRHQQLNQRAIELVCKHLPGAINTQIVLQDRANYDLQWKSINIDVKVARLSKGKWIFNIDKPKCKANIVILFALTDPEFRVFVVPIEILPMTMVTIRKKDGETRYDIFRTELNNLEKSVSEARYKVKEIVTLARKGNKSGGEMPR